MLSKYEFKLNGKCYIYGSSNLHHYLKHFIGNSWEHRNATPWGIVLIKKWHSETIVRESVNFKSNKRKMNSTPSNACSYKDPDGNLQDNFVLYLKW